MVPRSSGESMSYVIKTLSNNKFDDFISHVEYIQGNRFCDDLYLAHVNDFVSFTSDYHNRSFISYKSKNDNKKVLSSEIYYKTIKMYLKTVPILLVGTNPTSQEMEIIQ